MTDQDAQNDKKQNIINLVRNASLEITPGVRKKFESFTEVMEPGRRVFITYLPKQDPHEIVKTAIELRHDGMEPVPHLSARRMKDRKQLYEILERLRMEADVRDVLLLGGDAPKPVGEFSSSMDLLDTGYFQEFGFRSLGVAGHPEGNPDIPEDEIKRALLWKNEYARSHNVHMYIVTQFTFDPHSVYDWLEKLDQWGNELPVNVGLPGPAKLETLLKYSKLCGVRCSFNFLRKQGLKLLKLASISMPDHIISELARYYADHPHGPVTRLHFFNFGGVPLTMKFLHEIERGEFDVKWIGSGFNLHHKLH